MESTTFDKQSNAKKSNRTEPLMPRAGRREFESPRAFDLAGFSARAVLASSRKLILINEKSTRRGPGIDFNQQKIGRRIVRKRRAQKKIRTKWMSELVERKISAEILENASRLELMETIM